MRKLSALAVATISGVALYFTLVWGYDGLRMFTSPSYGLEDVWRSQFVFGIGSLFGYKGGVILVVGDGFSNKLTQYDDFTPGARFNPDGLTPFSFTVRHFHVTYDTSGAGIGTPLTFDAALSVTDHPGAALLADDPVHGIARCGDHRDIAGPQEGLCG